MANIKISLSSDKNIDKTNVYSDFDVDSKYMNSTLKDRKAVRQSLYNILNWRPKERILYPSFGNTLWMRVFDNFSSFSKQDIIQEVERMVSNEPRVKVEGINVSTDIKAQEIFISFSYSIPSLDTIDGSNLIEEFSLSISKN